VATIGAIRQQVLGLNPPIPEDSAMIWETPDFIEVKMDAEINSYQDDFERESDDRF
jgi:coenzyme PQQ precursor peptide PqqA